MRFTSILGGLTVLSCLALFSSAAPSNDLSKRQGGCSSFVPRKSWKTFTSNEKRAYTTAVRCLRSQPPTIPGSGMPSLYDEFPYVHFMWGREIHWVAQFLPWHRRFAWAYDYALRSKCGYQGPGGYWDWTLDADTLDASPIFDPYTGFGGNGNPRNNYCVDTTAFRGMMAQVYNGRSLGTRSRYCLIRRYFNDGTNQKGTMRREQWNSTVMNGVIQNSPTYGDFRWNLESGPHGAVHNAVGLDYATWNSPNDPIFFLMHNNVDRLWASWQSFDQSRMWDMSGPSQAWSNDNPSGSPPASLDTPISLFGLMGLEDIPTSQLMDTSTYPTCYTYDKLNF